MKTINNIESLLKKLNHKTSDEFRKQVLEKSFTILERQKPSQNIWRIIMRRPIVKFAAAAVIIIAVFFGINHLGGSIDGAGTAWANTLEQIYKATSVTYNKAFCRDKQEPFFFQEMINEKGVQRAIIGGQIMIYDFGTGKSLMLIPSNKEATLTQEIGGMHAIKPYNQLEWLISIKDKAAEFLGTENIDGIWAKKFFWNQGEYCNTTVWVNPSTNLPVRVEQVFLKNPNKDIISPSIQLKLSDFGGPSNATCSVGGGGGKGIQDNMTMIMKDFIWNQQLDPALFSTEAPEDYTLRKKQHNASEMDENDLVKALAFWAEMSDGSFPQKINDLADPNQINPKLILKFNRGGNPQDEIDEAMNQASIIIRGLFFVQNKIAENNWTYEGDGVKFGQKDTPICWWKPEKSENYKVIYADLSIGEISAQDIPK